MASLDRVSTSRRPFGHASYSIQSTNNVGSGITVITLPPTSSREATYCNPVEASSLAPYFGRHLRSVQRQQSEAASVNEAAARPPVLLAASCRPTLRATVSCVVGVRAPDDAQNKKRTEGWGSQLLCLSCLPNLDTWMHSM